MVGHSAAQRETVMAEIPPGEAALPAASKITIDDESDDTESDTTPAEIKAKIERDVDELFKTKTVEEMEVIEKKLRGDLETMDAEIARTIGGSWKDFMENSKDIDLITSNLQEIVDGFAVVRDTLAELPEIIRKNNEAMEALRAPQEPEEFTPEMATFAAGSRLKYLVDTPEKVWGALDEREYAGAAMRYVAARDCVAACVETSEPPHLTRDEAFKKFPALRQQPQALDSLRAQIARAARKALESPKQNRATIASALAASIVVEGMSAERALVLYLQTRRAWIRATLRRCGGDDRVDRVAGALARVLAEPARAIAAARACFLGGDVQAQRSGGGESPVVGGESPTPSDSPPLVYARLDEGWDETDVANVLFAGVVDPRREAEAWRRVVDSAKPARLSRARVAALCEEWLAGVASDALVATAEKGFMGGIRTVDDLVRVESVARAKAEAARMNEADNAACVDLLGRAADAWETLAEEPTSHRARALLAATLGHGGLRTAVDAALEAAAPPAPRSSALSPPAESAAMWGGDGDESESASESASKSPRSALDFEAPGGASRDALVPANVAAARALAGKFASSLRRARGDALAIGTPQFANGRLKPRVGLDAPARESPRARLATLEAFVRGECHAGAMATAEFLWKRLEAYEKDAAAGDDVAAERCLLVAQTAQFARLAPEELGALMGPARDWNADAVALAKQRRRAARSSAKSNRFNLFGGGSNQNASDNKNNNEEDPRLAESLAAFARVAHRGFRAWAERFARTVGVELSRALPQDERLGSREVPRDWEEESGLGDESGGDGKNEVSLRLPALPSPYALGCLHAASSEALRCGGHLMSADGIAALVRATAKECGGAYADFVQSATSTTDRLSERGVLQAMFDLRFVMEVLLGPGCMSGGRGKAGDANDEGDVLVAATRAERTLAARLDPIDWATYESFLWRNERRAYSRCATLLGLLTQSHRAPAGADKVPPATSSDAKAATPPPRFTYLPVSLPARAGKGGGKGDGSSVGAVDWSLAGFDRFGDPDETRGAGDEGGLLGKIGQGLGGWVRGVV